MVKGDQVLTEDRGAWGVQEGDGYWVFEGCWVARGA